MNVHDSFPATGLPTCLNGLGAHPRWVVWTWEFRKDKDGNDKPTKPPRTAFGGVRGAYAKNDDPNTWTTLADAMQAAQAANVTGIGLQLLDLKGFAALDLDNVRAQNGDLLPWARELVVTSDSYAEWTPSGDGARILGRVPPEFRSIHKKRNHANGGVYEIYANTSTGRYITVTGDQIEGTPDALVDISDIVDKLDNLAADKPDPDQSELGQPEQPAKPKFEILASLDVDSLPGWIGVYLSGGGTGDRSADFQAVVNALRPRGWTFEAALKLFQDNLQGPASKYIEGDRLESELRRSWDKAKAPQTEIHKPEPATDPVDLWGSFDPPALPQGLLPPIIERFARANGDQMGADPAGLAMGALATCAAAIPDAVRIKVKRHDDWKESARLWVALVGPPSAKKSPSISAATGPLCRLDLEMMRAWQERVAKYEALSAEERKGKQRPPQTRLRIEDATVEAVQQVLEGSPWGVLLLQDELSGFFGAMDKYNGGKGAAADRAFWLRSFNGGQFALNRVGRGVGIIDNLSVSMLGGIQPEPLRKIAGDSLDDGLLQRLFPIILGAATMGRDEPMPPVNDQYRQLIEALRRLAAPGFVGTGVLEFDDGAQRIRRDLEARHLELQSLETINRKLASHIGKYDGLFARLCVVWHCIEHIENTMLCDAPAFEGEGLPVTVTEATAQRVAEFLHRFLLAHAIAFYSGVLGLADDHDRLTAIAGHILAHKLDRITNRDVQRGDRTMRGLKDFEIRPLLEQLAALGWLDRIDPPRPTSPPHWQVNPAVHRMFTDRAAHETERRGKARQTISALLRGND